MKRLLLLILSLASLAATSALAQGGHYFLTGVVESISDKQITVAGKSFTIRPKKTRIAVQTQKNGAFFENPARYSEIPAGAPVMMKVTGEHVDEIVHERWKQ